jgi:hypothetical protein
MPHIVGVRLEPAPLVLRPVELAQRNAAPVVSKASVSTFGRSVTSARLIAVRSWLMSMLTRCSPDQWHETMSDSLLVLRVSRQIPGEDFLLVDKPPYQERHHGREGEETPVRAKRERRAKRIE